MINCVINGYTGTMDEGKVIIHSPDGHVMYCKAFEINNRDELKGFVKGFLAQY